MDKKITKNHILLLSLTIYIISLTQDAFRYNDFDGQKTDSSISLLFMGALAILGGGLLEWFIWLANPFYFLSLILFFKSNKLSKTTSLVATMISLSFMTWKNILASENGRTATIDSLNLGYWLWVLSLTILSLGIVYYFKQPRNKI